MTEPADTFAEVFTRQLGAERWSKSRAARHFGVNQSTVSRWCSGDLYPGEDLIPAVAEWLGLDADTVRSLKYDLNPVSLNRLEANQESLTEKVAAMEQVVAEHGEESARLRAELRIVHAIVDRIAKHLPGVEVDDDDRPEPPALVAEFRSDAPSADGG